MNKKLIKDLQEFHLSKWEAKTYLALVTYGQLTAYEISKRSGVPQPKVYEVVQLLIKKSIIESTSLKPKKYRAIKPEFALRKIIKMEKQDVDELKEKINIISKHLNSLNRNNSYSDFMDIKEIEKRMKEKAEMITKGFEEFVPKNHNLPNLYEGMWYAFEGGKKLRPFLCLEACRLLGGKEEKAMPYAIACETLHNWILIHDDIEDGDRTRRGKDTVWVKYGIPHAVNIGDMMAHKVFEIILRSSEKGLDSGTILRLIKLIKDTTIRTGEGQTMEMNMRDENDFTEDEYLKTITLKTGYYLASPIMAGAIIADTDEFIVSSIGKYGEYMGPAFQIRDDIIDLTKGKGRGEIGCDIKEGKRSLLIAYTAKKCREEEKERLFEILNKKREKTTKEDIDWVIKLFKKYGAIRYAQKKAEELVKKAEESIKDLPEEFRDFLSTVAKFAILREK